LVLIFLRGEWHPTLLWPNGWMDEDATWYGSRPRRRPHCIKGFPALRERGTTPPPSFRPMSIVATVAHLSYCWALVSVPVSIITQHTNQNFAFTMTVVLLWSTNWLLLFLPHFLSHFKVTVCPSWLIGKMNIKAQLSHLLMFHVT